MPTETGAWRPHLPQGSTVLRASILVLTSMLIGMGAGGLMPQETRVMCLMIGFYGLVAFFGLSIAAYYRARRGQAIRQARTEERAQRRLQIETGLLEPRSLSEPTLSGGAFRQSDAAK